MGRETRKRALKPGLSGSVLIIKNLNPLPFVPYASFHSEYFPAAQRQTAHHKEATVALRCRYASYQLRISLVWYYLRPITAIPTDLSHQNPRSLRSRLIAHRPGPRM